MECSHSGTANKLSVINSSRQFFTLSAKIKRAFLLFVTGSFPVFLLVTSSAAIQATATFFLLRRTLNIGIFD